MPGRADVDESERTKPCVEGTRKTSSKMCVEGSDASVGVCREAELSASGTLTQAKTFSECLSDPDRNNDAGMFIDEFPEI